MFEVFFMLDSFLFLWWMNLNDLLKSASILIDKFLKINNIKMIVFDWSWEFNLDNLKLLQSSSIILDLIEWIEIPLR